MILTRTVGPAEMAVTVLQAKQQCRVDSDDDDALFVDLIATVTDYLDGPSGILGRAIITQTWTARLPGWPPTYTLPIEPVSAVVVRYTDQTAAEQTLDAALYNLISPLDAAPVIRWETGAVLPVLGSGDYPVEISMTAGYGGAEAVPATIKRAMLMLIEHWYDNRGVQTDTEIEMPMGVSALLGRYRRLL